MPKKKECDDCIQKNVDGPRRDWQLKDVGQELKPAITSDFFACQQSYCMRFEQVSNNYGFRKDMIESMKKTPYSVDQYWSEPGCLPRRIRANTLSPLFHLAAESAGPRKPFIETLYKSYQEKNENEIWLRIVNSKNTRGDTILDYIDYLNFSKTLREDEKPEINELMIFPCDRGGIFSKTSNKCPIKTK